MPKPQPKALLALTSAAMVIAAAACGQSSFTPATQLVGATVAQPQARTQQAETSSDSSGATQAAGSATAGTSPATASAGDVLITLNAGNSQAQYQTQEQLAGHNLPNTAVGKTTGVSGNIALTANGQLGVSPAKITVNLTGLKSDESLRDTFVQRNTLQTSHYPSAVFIPTQISGLASLPTSGSARFQMSGNLTVHGVTKPVTWTVTAAFNGQQVSGTATTPFTITEFGMTLPKAGPVLSLQDAGMLELDFNNVALAG